ncbi:MAG: hypothetical protein H7831_04400 [Magnetococcus sp. WYHC-3]
MQICKNEQDALILFKTRFLEVMKQHQHHELVLAQLLDLFDTLPHLMENELVVERCHPCRKEQCRYYQRLHSLAVELERAGSATEILRVCAAAGLDPETHEYFRRR